MGFAKFQVFIGQIENIQKSFNNQYKILIDSLKILLSQSNNSPTNKKSMAFHLNS
jgi:hypothetical protein